MKNQSVLAEELKIFYEASNEELINYLENNGMKPERGIYPAQGGWLIWKDEEWREYLQNCCISYWIKTGVAL